MRLFKKTLQKVLLFSFILSATFFPALSSGAAGLEAGDIINGRENLLKQSITSFAVDTVYLDRNHKPADLSMITWICFKERHQFVGYDRNENVFFMLFPCATGRNTGQKQKSGDMRTPEGDFRVQQIQEVSWWPPYTDSETGEKIGYGPYFIRIDTGRWKGIGIHGTDEDHLDEIGTNASHGCIRLKNQDLLEVVAIAMVDQQVLILP